VTRAGPDTRYQVAKVGVGPEVGVAEPTMSIRSATASRCSDRRYNRGVALDLIAELEAVLDALAGANVDHALCGGLAVAIHGHPRATMDIDVLVPGDRVEAAMRAAGTVGFDLPARKMVQRVSKVDPHTGALLSLDLLVVGPTLADVWSGRTSVRWRDRDVAIVSRDGLIAMKRMAGRPQDLADISTLEAQDDDDDA
jgi:hypothetical protein